MSAKRFTPPATTKLNLNDTSDALFDLAVARGEGHVASTGALAVETGEHTGRSALDKFIVRDAQTESTVWWDNAASMTPAQFDLLHDDFMAHVDGKELFAQDLFGGRLMRIIACQYASSLNMHGMRCSSATFCAAPRRVNWTDLPKNSQSWICQVSALIQRATAFARKP